MVLEMRHAPNGVAVGAGGGGREDEGYPRGLLRCRLAVQGGHLPAWQLPTHVCTTSHSLGKSLRFSEVSFAKWYIYLVQHSSFAKQPLMITKDQSALSMEGRMCHSKHCPQQTCWKANCCTVLM